ncbi:MAG: aspartyl protease, partial [Bacteroidota bacterium]|nr:aspartyl protease [Bacteroidota bacterium]
VNNEQLHIAYVPRNGRATVGLILEDCDEFRSGLRQGDTIKAINGQPLNTFDDFLKYPFVEGREYNITVRTKEGSVKSVMMKR